MIPTKAEHMGLKKLVVKLTSLQPRTHLQKLHYFPTLSPTNGSIKQPCRRLQDISGVGGLHELPRRPRDSDLRTAVPIPGRILSQGSRALIITTNFSWLVLGCIVADLDICVSRFSKKTAGIAGNSGKLSEVSEFPPPKIQTKLNLYLIFFC